MSSNALSHSKDGELESEKKKLSFRQLDRGKGTIKMNTENFPIGETTFPPDAVSSVTPGSDLSLQVSQYKKILKACNIEAEMLVSSSSSSPLHQMLTLKTHLFPQPSSTLIICEQRTALMAEQTRAGLE
ncbi:hypothetical protein E5288_WYG001232 [Bos mutus]|uniref:Uncharacterized protein n=1 Tax=Bos mutus TaxID=72004 RepID=A0A6B0S8K2_9CETA|nr:hypothetical protein [Bos mutus]